MSAEPTLQRSPSRRLAVGLAAVALIAAVVPGGTAEAATHHRAAAVAVAKKDPFKPFEQKWIGHDRSLSILSTGVGHEVYANGCCPPLTRYAFTLSKVRKDKYGRPVATLTITKIKIDKGGDSDPKIHVGSKGTAAIRRGVFYDSVTGGTFCNAAAEERGVCGA